MDETDETNQTDEINQIDEINQKDQKSQRIHQCPLERPLELLYGKAI